MANKRRWIQSALKPENSGKLKAKAEAAGKTTREFAAEHSGDSDKTGKQARLAETLMGMHHKTDRAKRLYTRTKG